jgi:bifunctional UDP-N-acetylglucosamine pyrophosphorylase/glucosamine-1-phosphate N-acetyltransferase
MIAAFITDAGAPDSCQPLTCTRPLAEIPVANRPLREQQAAVLRAAGAEILAEAPSIPGRPLICLAGNAWVTSEDLALLLAADGPAVLHDAAGRHLAWLTEGSIVTPSAKARNLVASKQALSILYPWDLLRVNELLVGALAENQIEGTMSDRVEIDGHLVLGAGSRILPGVYIEGNVVIGRDCKIGPNCYIRGSTAIGDNCHVGQAVEIKNCILMDHVAIGHLSYVGDSIFGSRTNLGAGTITANLRHDGSNHQSMVGSTLVDTGRRKFGAILGDNVHTGIHTSLYPGRKLWPGMGTLPGAIVRKDLREKGD